MSGGYRWLDTGLSRATWNVFVQTGILVAAAALPGPAWLLPTVCSALGMVGMFRLAHQPPLPMSRRAQAEVANAVLDGLSQDVRAELAQIRTVNRLNTNMRVSTYEHGIDWTATIDVVGRPARDPRLPDPGRLEWR